MSSASGPEPVAFDLRVDAGRARLELKSALRDGLVHLEALGLELPGLRFPLALSGGIRRFRHRRTKLRHARIKLALGGLVTAARARGARIALHRDPIDASLVHVDARDELGDFFVAVRLVAMFDRFEVGIEHATAFDAPAYSSYRRAHALCERLGFVFDETRGTYGRALPRELLRQLLVTRGWRLPETHGVLVRSEVTSASVCVRLDRDEVPLDASVPLAIERFAARAPTLRRLFDLPVASTLAAIDADFARELAFEAGEPLDRREEGSLRGLVLALREAVRSADVLAAAKLARRLADRSPSPGLAAAGLEHAASIVSGSEPELAMELLARASALSPANASIASALATLAADCARPEVLAELRPRAMLAIADLTERAETVRALVAAHLRLSDLDGAFRLLDELLAAEPSDLVSLGLLADIRLLAGDATSAHATYVRWLGLAQAQLDKAAMRAAWLGLASTLLDLRDEPAALTRLLEARSAFPDDLEILSALALCAQRLSRGDLVKQTLAHLVTLPLDASASDALVLGCEVHLAHGEVASAQAFLDALRRAEPGSPRLGPLRARVVTATARRALDSAAGVRGLDLQALEELASVPDFAAQLVPALLGLLDESPQRPLFESLLRVARVAAEHDPSGQLRAKVAEGAAHRAELLGDVVLTESLEAQAHSDAAKARLAHRASELYRLEHDMGAAARAMARAAFIESDAARMRAAVELAESSEAWADAQAIVAEILRTLEEGPAKRAWLDRWHRLESLKTEFA